MQKILGFIRLIRFSNLVFVALSQFLLFFCVIKPYLESQFVSPSLSGIQFLYLVLSTIAIAAAGNIINDYFDVNIDLVNRPETIIIDKVISRRWAMAWHTIFNLLGVYLAFRLALKLNNLFLSFIQITCTILLWFYSTSLKRKLFVGNFVIALLTSTSLIIVLLYEPHLYSPWRVNNAQIRIYEVVFAYSLFAFVITIIREVIKDLEDLKGDIWEGCRTTAIVWGINGSKRLCYILIVFLILILILAQVKIFYWHWYIAISYLFFLVQLPFVWVMILLQSATSSSEYHKLSKFIKLIMLTGILSMIFFKIQF